MCKAIALLACLLCTGVALGQSTELAGASPNRSAQVAPCASQIKYYPDGKPSSCQVSQAFFVGTIQIPSGSDIAFRPNGEVGSAWLGEDGTVYGQALPAGTTLGVALGRTCSPDCGAQRK